MILQYSGEDLAPGNYHVVIKDNGTVVWDGIVTEMLELSDG